MSLHWAFRMVRETSPSASLPSSWYLEDLRILTDPYSEERRGSEHLLIGSVPCPQQKLSTPWIPVSYPQGRVTLCPMRPRTSPTACKDSVEGGKLSAADCFCNSEIWSPLQHPPTPSAQRCTHVHPSTHKHTTNIRKQKSTEYRLTSGQNGEEKKTKTTHVCRLLYNDVLKWGYNDSPPTHTML